MLQTPLMPKATAVWLVDNTSLTFEQVADFCKLHPLEVKGIADGEVAAGIKGFDPVANGQLTREEIEKAERDPDYRLKMSEPKVKLPQVKPTKKGPRYTPVSRRQDRPNAILGLASQFDLDFEVQRAAKDRPATEPAESGQTLLPAEISTAAEPAAASVP